MLAVCAVGVWLAAVRAQIAAIVVWRVAGTARSTYAVDSYETFVSVQAESALRHVATTHRYDAGEGETSLRGSTD